MEMFVDNWITRSVIVMISVVFVIFGLAFLTGFEEWHPLQDRGNAKHFYSPFTDWISKDGFWKGIARILFLAAVFVEGLALISTMAALFVKICMGHANFISAVLNIVVVVGGSIIGIILVIRKQIRRNAGNFMWIYSWCLLLMIFIDAVMVSVYFDGESGLDGITATIYGCFILMSIVVMSINMGFFIFDTWKNNSKADLQWFRRTLLYQIMSGFFVLSVVILPMLKGDAAGMMLLSALFSIAFWQYISHLWDERIQPKRDRTAE